MLFIRSEEVDNIIYKPLSSHFWVGSFCSCSFIVAQHKDNPVLSSPSDVVGSSDIIRIYKDMGNNMPDKSWMLYLLELFDSNAANHYHHTSIELNLICQFNDQDNFWAIYAGVNRYRFTKVVPIVGHSYLREIILHRYDNSIEYRVTDLDDNNNNNNNAIEYFTFQLGKPKSTSKSFQGSSQFTGIEWWNKAGNSPFPIRYEIEFSNLRYAQAAAAADSDGKNIERVTFRPYDALVPNKDGNAKEYPVSFGCADINDGCIRYTVTAGSCKTGLAFLPVR
jgi:hypothetical protein